MRFSNEIIALLAAASFGTVSAAPVAAPEAEAAPHNYFRSRYGYDGYGPYGGYRAPIIIGPWKRNEGIKPAPVIKREIKATTITKRNDPNWKPNEQGPRREYPWF